MSNHDPSASQIVVYSSPLCGYCAAAKRLLRSKGADFLEINVLANPKRRRQMLELSGRRTVPQIFIGGRHVGGYSDLSALETKGELDALLAEEA
jgi:glutaredoxin 3